jgi:YGGT family
MQYNPYPEEPINRQPTEANPPMQPGNPQYPQNRVPIRQNATYPVQDAERAATGQERASTVTYAIAKLNDYIWWILLVLEVILFLRFLLKLIGADPSNPFASFLYSLANIFLFIFKGIVADWHFGASVFEWSTLIGMLVYALIFWALRLFLRTVISRPQEPV